MKGEIKQLEYVWLATAMILLMLVLSPSILAGVSANNKFNVTPDEIEINWTFGSINLTANNITNSTDNITLLVGNASTMIFSNYSQYTLFEVDDYPSLTVPNFDICFDYSNNTYPNNPMKFLVQNLTGYYTNTSGPMYGFNSTVFNLTPHLLCPPGKYYGYFYVYNSNNLSDKVAVNANLNIPISGQNTYSSSNMRAFFKGSLSAANPLHNYYMNTSFQNVTSFVLNMTWSNYSRDIDVFLFNLSSSLLGKSIEKTTYENLYYTFSPNEMLRFGVYGAFSQAYTTYLYFSTINSSEQQLNYGSVNPNQSSSNLNFTLSNLDDRVIWNVTESVETYRKNSWSSSSQGTFRFLVPNFATKVKAVVKWTNTTNRLNISLRNPSGKLIGSSSSKYNNANKTGVIMEEYVTYTGAINTTNDGYWTINVTKITNETGSFDVEAYVWMGSGWVRTNFTSGFDFNPSGSAGSSTFVKTNVTLPSASLLNGSYEGYITYSNGSGWKYRIPITFGVKAGNLMINDSFQTTDYYYVDNTGFNRTGAKVIQASIIYNNTGGYPVYHTTSTSSGKLSLSTNYISFVVGSLPNPIPVNGNGTIKINFTVDTSKTHNTQGIYTGWLAFLTDNTTVNSSSYPHKTFNITLRINLTNWLNVTIDTVNPSLVNNTVSNNITIKAMIRLANGTEISRNGVFNYSNFTTLRVRETNVTSTYYDLTNKRAGGPGGSGCAAGAPFYCFVNGTLASNRVGGKYNVYAYVSWNTTFMGGTGEVNLAGNNYKGNFLINDTGIYLDTSPNGTGITMDEQTTKYYYVRVKNYGPVKATGLKVQLYDPASCYVSVIAQASGCTSESRSGENFTFTLNPYSSAGCLLKWKVTSTDVSEDKSCEGKLRVWNAKTFENKTVYISVISNTTTPSTPPPMANQATSCSTNSNCAYNQYCSSGSCVAVSCPNGYISNHACVAYTKKLEITSYNSSIQITQGESASTTVSVKNTGNVLLTAKMLVGINTSNITAKVSPTSYSLNTSVSGVFSVNFTVPLETPVGYYVATLKVYYPEDTTVYNSKDVTIAVLPLEETKALINATFADLKILFDKYRIEFEKISGAALSTANYTRANRSYTSLVAMFSDVEEFLSAGNYLEANSLLDDINRTLGTFNQYIEDLMFESQILVFGQLGDMWTWVAIGIVVIVIMVFVVYLFLPPKEGYHPLLGFKPKKESVFSKIGSHLKRLHHHMKKQMNLKQFAGKSSPPAYMEGYSKIGKMDSSGFGSKIKKKLGKK
ncbi:MAG: hypothetical protein JW754_00880 [Candidatus Aenigmarchaeota archaeon]|nr:hypothetical protein [Candidatus Aenigmarchaeota archaeon]